MANPEGGALPRAPSVEDDATPFTVDGRKFYGMREIGFNDSGAFVIDAWTTPPPMPRGSFFACIPISSAEYRKTHPTQAAFARRGRGRIDVLNDWGQATTIRAPQGVISKIVQGCIKNGLPEITTDGQPLASPPKASP